MSRLSPRQVIETYLDRVVPAHSCWSALLDGLRLIGEGVQIAIADEGDEDAGVMRRMLDTGSRYVQIGEKLLSERSADSPEDLRRFVRFQLEFARELADSLPPVEVKVDAGPLDPWECVVAGTAALHRAVTQVEEGASEGTESLLCSSAIHLLARADAALEDDGAFGQLRLAIAKQVDLAHTLLVLPRPGRKPEAQQ